MPVETAETKEQHLVTQCAEFMWNRICLQYSPDAIKEMQWAMSKETIRQMVTASLNGVEMAGYRIVEVADLTALLAFFDHCTEDLGLRVMGGPMDSVDRIRALIGGDE